MLERVPSFLARRFLGWKIPFTFVKPGLRSPDSQLFVKFTNGLPWFVVNTSVGLNTVQLTVRENPTFSALERFADGKIPRKKTE